jgi:hypothetical protein
MVRNVELVLNVGMVRRTSLINKSTHGTGHLIRHIPICPILKGRSAMAQSQLKFNPDGFVCTWDYSPNIARTQLCRLIARLDLPYALVKLMLLKSTLLLLIILDFVMSLGKQPLDILLSTLMIVVHSLLRVSKSISTVALTSHI